MLETNSVEMWENEVREYVEKVALEVKADHILVQTLEGLLNRVDSDILAKRSFAFRIEPITKVINQEAYYHRFRSNEEIKLVKELAEKLNAILKVAKYEDKLSQPENDNDDTKDRLPNTPVDVREMYGTNKPQRRY